MPEDEDFADRLEGLDFPCYVTITVDGDDNDVRVSTNAESNADVLRMLALAVYHFADSPEWVDDAPPDT